MEEKTKSIPDKLFFKIGEVSKIADIKPHVLRYWESEFADLQPVKSKSGQRVYRRKDVELVLKIKHLLHAQRFTIEGARKKLREKGRKKNKSVRQFNLAIEKGEVKKLINEVKEELSDIMNILRDHP